MRASASVLLVLAGTAAAQTPPSSPADPRGAVAAPMVNQQGAAGSQRQPAASRNQFFNPVMGVQIEGPGLGLPKGVADEEPIKPPAAEPQSPIPTPPASPK